MAKKTDHANEGVRQAKRLLGHVFKVLRRRTTHAIVVATLTGGFFGYRVRVAVCGGLADETDRHYAAVTTGHNREAVPLAAAIDVKALPRLLQGNGTRESALENVQSASQIVDDVQSSVLCSVALLDCTVGTKSVSISTLGARQRTDLQYSVLVRSAKLCFKVIGRYDRPLNGDPQALSAAVLKFQHENKLRPDGVIGGKTWKVLRASVMSAAESPDFEPND